MSCLTRAISGFKGRYGRVEKKEGWRGGGLLKQEHPSTPPAFQSSLTAALAQVIERGVFTPSIEVKAFEQELARYVGVEFAVGAASGSMALLLALKGLGLGAGDEVILAPNVDISVSAPISHAGVRQVWADIHPRTYNLDSDRLEEKITPKTRAIIAVHMYGNPVEMAQVGEIAARYHLSVIEVEYEAEGFNARLDELQAAVLRVKLGQLAYEIQQRRANAVRYKQLLADLEPEHLLLPLDTPGAEPLYRTFVIRSPRRDVLLRHLAGAGLWAGLSYVPPLHLQPVYTYLGYRAGDFPQTELVAQELLCLPTKPELPPSEIERVGQEIRNFFLS
jgi:dTDP-4-amino-4,6-dideoxygalactose transaminase